MKLSVDIDRDEFEKLKAFAKLYHCTPAEILGNFCHDLLGTANRTNGSDERDLADRYFQRTYMSWKDDSYY
ncbi:hypothetical protein E4665_07145 [Sporolactobacillus shoreae]|uniref:Uncharacterized protein n=1 Tax=Sporolactobacillus shoreae TaxID=1465501 RepID=A0A4Z0GQI7_9BACL|nr:hypothetical protein [Sporolactobacillus shoreae]TGA98633.1 hypothetical protein E4665_07145 [Sporolactobacillus shoreae]